VKCRNCDGQKVFRNAGCPTCARSGSTTCGGCGGSPWRERRCLAKDCRGGTSTCPACKGKGRVQPACGICAGEKRVAASGAVGKAIVTVKCRGCEGKGVAPMEEPCGTCAGRPEGLGRVRCESCATSPGFALDLAAVFTREPCAPCEGKGWPDGGRGKPCAACSGLGATIRAR
jgi:DnaJ-class molecular chaperone